MEPTCLGVPKQVPRKLTAALMTGICLVTGTTHPPATDAVFGQFHVTLPQSWKLNEGFGRRMCFFWEGFQNLHFHWKAETKKNNNTKPPLFLFKIFSAPIFFLFSKAPITTKHTHTHKKGFSHKNIHTTNVLRGHPYFGGHQMASTRSSCHGCRRRRHGLLHHRHRHLTPLFGAKNAGGTVFCWVGSSREVGPGTPRKRERNNCHFFWVWTPENKKAVFLSANFGLAEVGKAHLVQQVVFWVGLS